MPTSIGVLINTIDNTCAVAGGLFAARRTARGRGSSRLTARSEIASSGRGDGREDIAVRRLSTAIQENVGEVEGDRVISGSTDPVRSGK